MQLKSIDTSSKELQGCRGWMSCVKRGQCFAFAGLTGWSVGAGVREGALYEQLSMKYMKITGNMRRKQQELSKAEAVLHAE
eukprot:2338266-Rhodomonas_salina.1